MDQFLKRDIITPPGPINIPITWSGANPPNPTPNPAPPPDNFTAEQVVAMNTKDGSAGTDAELERMRAQLAEIQGSNQPQRMPANALQGTVAAAGTATPTPSPEGMDPRDLGTYALRGAASLGTGVARGLATIPGLPGDVAAAIKPYLPQAAQGRWDQGLPTSQQTRQALSRFTGGASEYNDPSRLGSDVGAVGESIPMWGKRVALAIASGLMGNEMARLRSPTYGDPNAVSSRLVTDNPNFNRAVGNTLPLIAPIALDALHGIKTLASIPKIAGALEDLLRNPLSSALSAVKNLAPVGGQYEAAQPLPLPPGRSVSGPITQ